MMRVIWTILLILAASNTLADVPDSIMTRMTGMFSNWRVTAKIAMRYAADLMDWPEIKANPFIEESGDTAGAVIIGYDVIVVTRNELSSQDQLISTRTRLESYTYLLIEATISQLDYLELIPLCWLSPRNDIKIRFMLIDIYNEPHKRPIGEYRDGRITWSDIFGPSVSKVDLSYTYQYPIRELLANIGALHDCKVTRILDATNIVCDDSLAVCLVGLTPPPGEIFMERAKGFLTSKLLGEHVYIFYDTIAPPCSTGNRAYIIHNGIVNAELIRKGLSGVTKEYYFNQKVQYLRLEDSAKTQEVGIWQR